MTTLTNISNVATSVDDLVSAVTETTGTFSFDETSALEQDALELTIAARNNIGSIWLDMVNVTQNADIAIYHKIDGTNYRQFQENNWTTVDDDGVLLDGFTAYRDVKVTLQCGGGGAGPVDIRWVVV